MGVLREDDLGPDGVRITVDWDAMKVRDSVFVPCLNTSSAIRDARKIFGRRGWSARFKICAHNHVWGVRIWRIA